MAIFRQDIFFPFDGNAQRPLLAAIQDYHRDSLVQVKDNQGKTLEKMKQVFQDAPSQEPDDRKVVKKKGLGRFATWG